MRLALALSLLIAVGAAFAAASPPRCTPRLQAKHASAERICKAQGPRCRVLSRSLTGIGCVCD